MNPLVAIWRPSTWIFLLTALVPSIDVAKSSQPELLAWKEKATRMTALTDPLVERSMNVRIHPVGVTMAERNAVAAVTNDLPVIDSIKLIALGGCDEDPSKNTYLCPDGQKRVFLAQKTIQGSRMSAIVDSWRDLKFNPFVSAMCHEPPYAMKLYSHGKEVAEATVCWNCSNAHVRNESGKVFALGFLKDDAVSQRLFGTLWKSLKNRSLEAVLSKRSQKE